MRRAMVAAVLASGLLAAGCSDGGGITRKAAAATERDRGPATRLAVGQSEPLPGEPGGMAADRDGAVVEIDDRTVVAFDTAGLRRWSSSVPGAALGWPWLGNGLVVVPTLTANDLGESSDHPHSGADDSGGCVALDRATGARRWSYEEAGRSGVSVASAGPRVFCVFKQGVIAAVDRDTGALLWRVLVDTRVPAAPVSVAERSAIAIDRATGTMSFTTSWGDLWHVIVRDLSTGADRGSFNIPGPVSSPVLVAPGILGIGTATNACSFDLRQERTLACLDVTLTDGFDPASVPVVADGTLVVAARDGAVIAVDIKSWKMIWGKVLPTPLLDTRLVISGGVVLLADWTRVPWALRMSDGSKIGVPTPDGFVIATAPATDPGGGLAVAVRADPYGCIERWVAQR